MILSAEMAREKKYLRQGRAEEPCLCFHVKQGRNNKLPDVRPRDCDGCCCLFCLTRHSVLFVPLRGNVSHEKYNHGRQETRGEDQDD
jgi:hypothetical protein